jgi:SEC-C motif-containing protein
MHAGVPAPSAEALMRSRYSAYAAGDAAYIVATTHPGSPGWQAGRAAWMEEVAMFVVATRFLGLTVHEAVETGDTAIVVFTARLEQGGRDATMHERSRFLRGDGRWLYHSAEPTG